MELDYKVMKENLSGKPFFNFHISVFFLHEDWWNFYNFLSPKINREEDARQPSAISSIETCNKIKKHLNIQATPSKASSLTEIRTRYYKWTLNQSVGLEPKFHLFHSKVPISIPMWSSLRLCSKRSEPKNPSMLSRGLSSGRYWTRTNDLCDVNATL